MLHRVGLGQNETKVMDDTPITLSTELFMKNRYKASHIMLGPDLVWYLGCHPSAVSAINSAVGFSSSPY